MLWEKKWSIGRIVQQGHGSLRYSQAKSRFIWILHIRHIQVPRASVVIALGGRMLSFRLQQSNIGQRPTCFGSTLTELTFASRHHERVMATIEVHSVRVRVDSRCWLDHGVCFWKNGTVKASAYSHAAFKVPLEEFQESADQPLSKYIRKYEHTCGGPLFPPISYMVL
jgi:hypothetical protein